jgi:hypothetical protein
MKYGYARVSTDGQSVDAQVRQLVIRRVVTFKTVRLKTAGSVNACSDRDLSSCFASRKPRAASPADVLKQVSELGWRDAHGSRHCIPRSQRPSANMPEIYEQDNYTASQA